MGTNGLKAFEIKQHMKRGRWTVSTLAQERKRQAGLKVERPDFVGHSVEEKEGVFPATVRFKDAMKKPSYNQFQEAQSRTTFVEEM